MNNVFLTGNLTVKPTETKFDSGNTLCRFTIAVNRSTKNGDNTADFISISTWNALAQNCIKYLDKGDRVAVVGSIQTSSYEKDGVKRTNFEVVANRVEFLKTSKADTRSKETADAAQELADEDMPY